MSLHIIERLAAPDTRARCAHRFVVVSCPFVGPGISSDLCLAIMHQNALFTVPPSTRNAAPVVAEDSGLATYATSEATSCGVLNRLSSEVGRTCSKNSFSNSAPDLPCSFASASTKSPTPRDFVGPGQHAVHRDAGAGDRFGDAARDRDLRRLGHAVVDHLRGNLHAALARDEDDAAPVGAAHGRQHQAREPRAARARSRRRSAASRHRECPRRPWVRRCRDC